MATPFDVVDDVDTSEDSPFPFVPATPPQQRYLRDLLMQEAHMLGTDDTERIETLVTTISKFDCSNAIDAALARVRDLRANLRAPEVEDGFYLLDDVDTPIRVIHAIHGSGHQYARALDKDTGKWDVKVPNALHRIAKEGLRIDNDPDAAMALGRLYGKCMVCGATLTDKNPGGSIERGIGPICAAKAGW